MVTVFTGYLLLKGLKHVWGNIALSYLLSIIVINRVFWSSLFGLMFGVAAYFFVRPRVEKKVALIGDMRSDLNTLFTIPLIFSAALLSFAHGANDVANAIGPLAAVTDALIHQGISAKASIPLWVMIVGGGGIAVGLALYGPRLIRTVGSEITELDQMRAFSIMMAAAITVLVASQFGLLSLQRTLLLAGYSGSDFTRVA